MDGDAVEDDGLGETEQAVSSVVVQSLTCSGQTDCQLDLHLTSADHACFLGGLSGKLDSGSYGQLNDVSVEADGAGEFHIHIFTSHLDTIWAEAVCVPVNAATVHAMSWDTSNPFGSTTVLAGGTTARRCFLDRIAGFHTFNDFDDYVEVGRSGSLTWYLQGRIDSPGGQTFAGATCFDVGADLIGDGWIQTSGTNILDLIGTHNGRSVLTACGINSFGGVYTTNDTANGQQLWRNTDWNWTLTGAVRGGVDCFQ